MLIEKNQQLYLTFLGPYTDQEPNKIQKNVSTTLSHIPWILQHSEINFITEIEVSTTLLDTFWFHSNPGTISGAWA